MEQPQKENVPTTFNDELIGRGTIISPGVIQIKLADTDTANKFFDLLLCDDLREITIGVGIVTARAEALGG